MRRWRRKCNKKAHELRGPVKLFCKAINHCSMNRKICFAFCLLALSLMSLSQEKLVTVNGINFNVFVKGLENRKAGTPAIIFENGMGMGHATWNTVIEQLSAIAPVFAYDRTGIGKSGKTFQMPTIKYVTGNLKELLNHLKIAPPYILVGHSMGGVYTRAFAGFYPNEIAGLVFIDPADFTESKQEWNQIFRNIGVAEKKIDEMLFDRLYKPTKIDSAYFGAQSELQVLRELRRNDFGEITALPVPSVPIYFFIGGKFEVPPERRSKDFDQEAFFTERTNVNIERWREFIYSSAKGGALIYLSKCGHFVHRDDPAIVTSIIGNLATDTGTKLAYQ